MNKKLDIRIIALIFFVLAVSLRFLPHFHNVSAVGALGMFVGCFWSARMGFLMALAAMGISDLLGHWFAVPSMGFYEPSLMVTVYLAVGCSSFVGKLISKGQSKRAIPYVAGVPMGAIASTLVFFLLTNFASWLDPQMGYAKTLSGLVGCYVAALPFATNTLFGNLLFSALFFGGYLALVSAPQATEVRSRVDS